MKTNYSIVILNALPDKKIKSLGNKYLIKINKKYYIVDYIIKFLNRVFNDPEIIIVGGFDSKRLKKYIENSFTNQNIKYVEHDVGVGTNIGTSINCGMRLVSNKNCWIINSSFLFNKKICPMFIKNLKHSFVIISEEKGKIGCTIDSGYLLNCYYDLPNTILDSLYISKNNFDIFYQISQSQIHKLYFFEIINMCIEQNIKLIPLNIYSKYIHPIDSIQSIKNIQSKICTI